MFRIGRIVAGLTVWLAACAYVPELGPVPDPEADHVVTRHGALSVADGRIVDAHGEPLSLAGPSFFWSTLGWRMDRYYNPDVVAYFADDWKAGIIRAAMSAQGQGSYLSNPGRQVELVSTLVDAAIQEDIYVVIDWHSHVAELHRDQAIEFFTQMAERYGDKPNVIYEIYNEPLNTTDWDTEIRPYAEAVIAAIREVDPDNLIIVGTQTWSQDVDKAADRPITGHDNIAYALHFYAGGHKEELRAKAQYALDKGLPIMVTEWGSVNPDGDGAVDYESVAAWMEFVRRNRLTHMMWSVADKDEASAILKPGTPPDGNWTEDDLTESGRLKRDIVRNWGR